MGDRTPTGVSYMLHENWGGTWSDAEKSRKNPEDDNMCWASAAANILEWTGWGHVEGMTTTDEVFAYFQDHWTNKGGQMTHGWQWWFTGVNPSNGWAGWSRVDVAGGGFHPSEDYSTLYHNDSSSTGAMTAIDTYLRSGYGTTIAVYGPGGHAITVWGLTHDADNPSEYNGLYVTDSDDYKNHPKAPDRLRYYEVEHNHGKWYLQNYFGSNDWYIGVVSALAPASTPPTAPGDLDGDSDVDAEDIDILAAVLRTENASAASASSTYDLNNDGKVNTSDMDKLIQGILGTDYGDFNLNGTVDLGDYTIWAAAFLTSELAGVGGWDNGDANGDTIIDGGDYTAWAIRRGFVSDASQYASTPEPGTVALLCAGAGLVLSRRRSRRR